MITVCLLAALCFSAIIKYPHYLPLLWRIPYFDFETRIQSAPDHLSELELQKSKKAIKALNGIRTECKAHYAVMSGYRNPIKNKRAGGVSNSQHLKGIAFDVIVPQSNRKEFYKCAKNEGFQAFGWGNRTVHIDMGPRRWWTYDDNSKHVSGEKKTQIFV